MRTLRQMVKNCLSGDQKSRKHGAVGACHGKPLLNRFLQALLGMLWCFFGFAQAHEISFSHIRLELNQTTQVRLDLPVNDLARQFSKVSATQLLQPKNLAQLEPQIQRLIEQRLLFVVADQSLEFSQFALQAVPDRQEIEATWQLPRLEDTVLIRANLFPDNSFHKTFLDVYQQNILEQQLIFDATKTEMTVMVNQQSVWEVLWNFLLEGIRHIFIGADHILFIVGLLLLGGNVWQLLKIVSAFTLAHSITLALATLQIFSPPARLVEATIAASIVVVGLDSLFKHKHERRTIFAFCFGLVHGFGFAAVLTELELPQQALGWSLLAFNGGVELGQMCIVLLVAPLLAWLRAHHPKSAALTIRLASLAVIAAGTYWFVERVVGA